MTALAGKRQCAGREAFDVDAPETLRAARRARREAPAVYRARPVPRERVEVLLRRVALVPREAVLGIAAMPAAHQPVAANLRENRRRADRRDLRVAVDDGLEQKRPGAAFEARQLIP